MSEDRRAGIVYSGSSGELVTAGDALGAPCWEPRQQERRRAATATALEALRSSLGNRQPGRIVDLGCGSGELTTRIASLWPAAEIVAVDQSDLMTLFTQGSALAAGHRNVRAITADVAGDLGIEPGSADLVVASCIANNMLNEIAGHCPDCDADAVGYARWYQDVLWAGQGSLEIPKRTRHEIARDLDLADFVHDADRFSALLNGSWVLDDDPLGDLTGAAASLRARIERHVFRNPGDWSAEDLFKQLGAFDASDTRFARFLEGLVSADVIPDEPAQRRVVGIVNPHLRSVGAELRETRADGGYPVFSVVSAQSARTGRPKNLIFASLAKPDIRFTDAIDNDIEIVGNADKILVYDRPIGGDGIRWRDLQAWWIDRQQLADEAEAKKSLYQRLIRSLPGNSPPQRNLYGLYHDIHGSAVPDLPALLPEVWLHWDPKTVRDRGPEALLRFRMDFLLLLPHGQRVVLEVDGSHHFTSPDGQADAVKYADSVRGDRDLKLSGYEVFRFGATELQDPEHARTLLQQFFKDLFRRFGVTSRTD